MKNDFDFLTEYARQRVETTQAPANLYSKAELKRNAADSVVTVLVSAALIWLSTLQFATKVSIQTPVAREYLRQELVVSGGSR